MNIADIVVLAVLALSTLLAFARGFVREMLSILVWVGAAVVTYFAITPAQPMVQAQIGGFLMQYINIDEHTFVIPIITGTLIFLLALIVLSIVCHYLAKLLHRATPGTVDRGLGIVFGLLRGAVLVCLAFLLLDWVFKDDRPGWFQEARSVPFVERGAALLRDLVPEEIVAQPAVEPAQLPGADLEGLQRAREALESVRQQTLPADQPQPVSPLPGQASPPPPELRPDDPLSGSGTPSASPGENDR